MTGESNPRGRWRFVKATLAALAVTIALAAAPQPAAAHPSNRWYWSPARAEERLVVAPKMFVVGLTPSWDVLGADCLGIGQSIRRDGRRLFKHFDCEVRVLFDFLGDLEVRRFERVLHATGTRSYVLYRR